MIRIYNTLTRAKETFEPLAAGDVRMYVCGVTVYDLSHVGHARSAIVFDVIRRYLAFRGYRVTFVKNFTDIDDKIIRRAAEEGSTAKDVSERNIEEYRRDMQALGVLVPDVEPKATEHVPPMIAIIERLVALGIAYVVDGDVYFEVRRFPTYGKLSRRNLDDLRAGARVEIDERKRDPLDFALWKASKPGEPAWESPWGPGRPGWHIECSAMSMQYLGESFDLHGGGEDLIFPHHENEIAQSEGCTGQPFARYWVHNGFVNTGAEKMSKSLGNTLTIRDLLRRHDADALRLFLLGTHYRNPVEFSEARIAEAARAIERFTRLVEGTEAGPAGAASGEPPADVREHRARFETAMDDDFNTPQALGVLFDLARALHDRRDRGAPDGASREALAAGIGELKTMLGSLGLLGRASRAAGPPADVQRLVERRLEARSQRDWARADELRARIQELGWAVEDTAAGPRVTPRT